jgi:uncharacterized protein (DUF2062 family)
MATESLESAGQSRWNRITRRLREIILSELKKGLSPDRASATIAVGLTIGLFPVLGTTTAMCVVTAAACRLNHAVIQAANYAATPAYFVVLIPFLRLGAWLFGVSAPSLTPAGLRTLFAQGWFAAVAQLGTVLLHGIAAWLLIAPLIALALFFGVRPFVRRTVATYALDR